MAIDLARVSYRNLESISIRTLVWIGRKALMLHTLLLVSYSWAFNLYWVSCTLTAVAILSWYWHKKCEVSTIYILIRIALLFPACLNFNRLTATSLATKQTHPSTETDEMQYGRSYQMNHNHHLWPLPKQLCRWMNTVGSNMKSDFRPSNFRHVIILSYSAAISSR